MKKLIILLGLPLIFNAVYGHTNNNAKLTVKQKSLLSLYLPKQGEKGKQGCMRLLQSLLNEHLKENGHHQQYVLKNGNLVVGTAKD